MTIARSQLSINCNAEAQKVVLWHGTTRVAEYAVDLGQEDGEDSRPGGHELDEPDPRPMARSLSPSSPTPANSQNRGSPRSE